MQPEYLVLNNILKQLCLNATTLLLLKNSQKQKKKIESLGMLTKIVYPRNKKL